MREPRAQDPHTEDAQRRHPSRSLYAVPMRLIQAEAEQRGNDADMQEIGRIRSTQGLRDAIRQRLQGKEDEYQPHHVGGEGVA